MPQEPILPKTDFHVWCICRSVDEGRKAAIRWLIEFIGITWDSKKKKAIVIEPHSNGKSVTIRQVGGTMFDPNHPEAFKLAKIWEACSQSSLHPTTDTGHCAVGEDEIATALEIVVRHLEISLYKPIGRELWQIVRDQEKMAIAQECASSR